jgi:hypothetical protein
MKTLLLSSDYFDVNGEINQLGALDILPFLERKIKIINFSEIKCGKNTY